MSDIEGRSGRMVSKWRSSLFLPALVCLLVWTLAVASPLHQTTPIRNPVSVTSSGNGSYAVLVQGKAWLSGAGTFVHVGGKKYSTTDRSLKQVNSTTDTGSNALGRWTSVRYNYQAGSSMVAASFISYQQLPCVMFSLEFPDGAEGTSVGDKDAVTTGFPGFKVDAGLADLGYLSLGDTFIGIKGHRFGRWNKTTFSVMDGLAGGPILLMDKGGRSLWICPFDQFMSLSNKYYQETGEYYWGVMGGVTQLTQGYSYKVLVFYGDGPNEALLSWGDAMRMFYKKERAVHDFTNDYLSYWSDNGAYYVNYYETNWLIQNMTYQEALLHYLAYGNKSHIPYRSIQYSVWFKDGFFGGTDVWTANPKLIPQGMKYMFQKTGIASTAHNRFWAIDTSYAKQNGGPYDFYVEDLFALPRDERFWMDFFTSSQQWGMRTLMQDWMNWQFMGMNVTTNNTEVASTWLKQMGRGASENGMTIQYCMALCRHVLQSLEIPSVTQVRASDDYQPGDTTRWRLGISSIVAYAVGLAPFKDTFWTTEIQPGNYYNGTEPHPVLLAAVSSLSAGPVGPGDMINGTDVNLLMKCCRADGLILKPSRPAMAIDFQFVQAAFGGDIGPNGEVWTTYSTIDGKFFGIIFAADVKNKYSLTPRTAGFGQQFPNSHVYSYMSTQHRTFSSASPLVIDEKCTMKNICMYYTSPVLQLRLQTVILLGETNKWIPMSPKRFTSISVDDYDVTLAVRGVPNEELFMKYILDGVVVNIDCIFQSSGSAVVSIKDRTCVV